MYTIFRDIEPTDGSNVFTILADGEDVVWRITDDCICRGVENVNVAVGDRIPLYKQVELIVLAAPNHSGHFLFKVENNLFTGVVDYREVGMKNLARGCNLYPGSGPVLDIYNERG